MGKTVLPSDSLKLVNPKTGKVCTVSECLHKFVRVIDTKTWERNWYDSKTKTMTKRRISFKHPFHQCEECGRKIAFRGDTNEARDNYKAQAFGIGKQKNYPEEGK